jgi:hypothetical protein
MKTKMFIIPILILALVTVTVAPPVHAELLTLSIILAVAFGTSIFINETLIAEPDNETASKSNESDAIHQTSINYSNLEPASK